MDTEKNCVKSFSCVFVNSCVSVVMLDNKDDSNQIEGLLRDPRVIFYY